MAAITPITFSGHYQVIRNVSAQATTGQTDWVVVPREAIWCEVFINITAVAGTTPILTPSFHAAAPATMDDSDIVQIHAAFTSPPTDVGTHRIVIGPGVAPADDVALAATGDSQAAVNIPLPDVLGVRITNDRTTGNETYTYSVSVRFWS